MGKIKQGSSTSSLETVTLETVVLENSSLRVSLLPSLGGKIASIKLKPGGEELLQQPLLPYAPRTRYMRFDESDASGWDECLPTVEACEVKTPSGVVKVPDHGDFWQVEWQVASQSKEKVVLSADGFSLPLRFGKTLHLEENRLRVNYSLESIGQEPLKYIWSAHPLFSVDPGDSILLPPSVKEIFVGGSAGNRLTVGSRQRWPIALLSDSSHADLSIVGNPKDGIGDKLFALTPAEGWCAIERKKLGRRIELHFDPQFSANLGLWICYGGWPEGQPNRQFCVALEPCNAIGDSLAIATFAGRARYLAPGGQDNWDLTLQVS